MKYMHHTLIQGFKNPGHPITCCAYVFWYGAYYFLEHMILFNLCLFLPF
jgi:hypothetical protein